MSSFFHTHFVKVIQAIRIINETFICAFSLYKLRLFKDKFVLHPARYIYYMSYTGIACIPYCIKKEDAPLCMHCTVNCQEDVREVLCVRGRFVARRAWPCAGVMSMRLEGKGGGGGGGEGMGKMDKKLPGSSELSWVRTFGRG
jgi:hypothetical protein